MKSNLLKFLVILSAILFIGTGVSWVDGYPGKGHNGFRGKGHHYKKQVLPTWLPQGALCLRFFDI